MTPCTEPKGRVKTRLKWPKIKPAFPRAFHCLPGATVVFLIAFVLALQAPEQGCQAPPNLEQDLPLRQLPVKCIERYSEWREARSAGNGTNQVIRLGEITRDAFLRLGVLEGEPHGKTASFRVYVDNALIHQFTTGHRPRWAEYRIPLNASQGICRLVINSPRAVWIGPCEIIQGVQQVPNVLIYLIDALRQDHLHCYGYPRDTSPNMDAVAQEGIRFTNLMPQSSWTKPSVASLLTSTYPNIHGAQDNPDLLRKDLPALAAALQQHGYETQGLITNPNLLPLWGFGAGFTRYVNVEASDTKNLDDANVVDTAIASLDALQGRPWFMYVHAMGPHSPYTPPPEYAGKFHPAAYADFGAAAECQQTLDAYDAEIAYSDAQLARLLDALKQRHLYENTLLLIIADHGEEFWDHGGENHGRTLYQEMLKIPLLMKLPMGRHAGESREALVEMIDIAPTILDCLALPKEERFQGRSFKELLDTGACEPRMGYASLLGLSFSARAVRYQNYKYLRDLAGGWEAFFDLSADPKELHGLATPPPEGDLMRGMAARIAARGGAGLHILMTCGDDEHVVTGCVQGTTLGPFDLSYYEWKGEAHREGNDIHFSWKTKHERDRDFQRDVWHASMAEQDHALLRIAAEPDQEIQLRIEVDGQPIPPNIVHIGENRAHRPLDGTSMKLADLAANADACDPASLPREFALYVWYVADADAIAPEHLDPAMRDALKALGYLN